MPFQISNLESMWRFGANQLPTAAIQFVEAATALNDARSQSSSAFDSPSLGTSPICEPWMELLTIMQDEVFVQSRDNLVKSGKVLAAYTIAVAEQDEAASTALNTAIEKTENGVISERPVTDVPPAPDSIPPPSRQVRFPDLDPSI